MTGFVIEPLASHDRTGFDCGVDPLNRYFREQATQDFKRRLANCFVAVDAARTLAGFYTLSATSLPMTDLPPTQAKRLPRYPLLPAGLIGRLAVARDFHKRGVGPAMIVDAIVRASRADPAIFALIVDAKDDAAAGFYAHLGFRAFESRPRSLFLPLGEALRLIQASQT